MSPHVAWQLCGCHRSESSKENNVIGKKKLRKLTLKSTIEHVMLHAKTLPNTITLPKQVQYLVML
jgi:hypothetical protein